mmetsp:Transcript_37958/g.92400  ORF Transcript_37958/g.92400 Transcript_37958/m.92400 type:complete len:765 (-) Transcript_37958:102-2396(-)
MTTMKMILSSSLRKISPVLIFFCWYTWFCCSIYHHGSGGHNDYNTRTSSSSSSSNSNNRIFLVDAADPADPKSSGSKSDKPLQCDLYLAPSTIPNAGQGIFSGVEKDLDDTIGNGDKALPLIDLFWNNGDYYVFPDPPAIDKDGNSVLMDPLNPHRRLSDREKDSSNNNNNNADPNADPNNTNNDQYADDAPEFFNQFGDYVWDGKDMGMQYESIWDDVTALWPGLDALVNCHSGLSNVEKATPIYSEDGMHRSTHPGAGAVSPYHAGPSIVTRHIPQGGELFKYYGDSWFETREDRFGRLPLYNHYDDIVFYINAIRKLGKTIDMRISSSSSKKKMKKKNDDVDQLRMGPIIYYELLRPMKDIWDSRQLNAIHDYSWEDMLVAADAHDMGLLIQRNSTRSIEWLNENGKCIDHIVQGQSTIDGAGQGAFAKRFLPKGTIITGTPLLHNPNGDQFIVYNQYPHTTPDGEPVNRRMIDSIRGKQLMYNYCWGHPESSILLCPDSSGVNYINHASSSSSTRTDDGGIKPTANVKVQWAKDGMTAHRDEWLKKTPDEMYEYGSFLALDFIALRDIEEGEELFMDYGPDWEQAWADHVENWFKSEAADPLYVSATQMNSRNETLRTLEEQRTDPYPINLSTMCHLALRNQGRNILTEADLEWELGDHGTPCEIKSRSVDQKTGAELYSATIRYIYHHKNGDKEVTKDIENVPRSAIKFIDRQYSTDLHLPQAFRHFVGIPDDIMPDQWKNRPRLNKSDKSDEEKHDEL